MIKCNKYIFLLLILVSIAACSESANNYPGEVKNLKDLSTPELATRVTDLEALLRKYRRLLELKNEQIVELKKDLAENLKNSKSGR